MWLEADSDVHPVHGEANGLEGEILLLVDRLESGNAVQDNERRHGPTPDHRWRGARGIQQGNGSRYQVRSDLTFHGVTQPVEGEVVLSSPDERILVMEDADLRHIREYGVDPPNPI